MANELPPGFEGEAEFLREARELFQMDVDADRKNRDAALDDLKFASDYEGAQWDETVRAARAGRPCLTNNVIPQYVGQVIGDSRINKPAIKVRPAEDADEDLADIRAGLIRSIERQSDAQGVYAKGGQSQVICGMGAFRCGLKYASDETFDRDLEIRAIPDALSVVWDCMAIERTGKDARRAFLNDEMPRKEFEARWPKAIPSDISADGQMLQSSGWVSRDTVRVTEYWRMVEEERLLGLTLDGKTIDITKGVPAGATIQRERKVKRSTPWMYLITGFSILDGPHKVPIDRIPIFRVVGQEYQVGNDRVWFGLVRFMKDQVRLQNYADSLVAEALALAPKAVWLGDDVAIEGREDAFRNAHRTGDPLLIKNQGGELQRVDPPVFPVAILQWRQTLTQSMKDVTGLHDASLGIQSNETSGKAIMARQREGDVATVIYHDNLNAAISECGRVLNQLIPIVYDTARTIRIVGEDESTKPMRVNDPRDPESVDLTQGKYDIVVETGPSYSTKRVEAAESMMQFVQAVPAAAAAAADLIAKSQDWPMAQEIGDRLKKLLPPGIADTDPKDLSPEEQQAAQDQKAKAEQQQEMQTQMAMAGAQAELTVKQAQAAKAMADAKRSEAEADKTEQETLLAVATQQANLRLVNAQADKAEADAIAVGWNAQNATVDAQTGMRRSAAEADKAEAEASASHAKAVTAHANAHSATVDAEFNTLDATHKILNGRGITDPEPAPEGDDA